MSDENASMFCVVCSSQGYMSEPTHADPSDGSLVFCCWSCREHRAWEIELRGLVLIHDWLESIKQDVTEDWDDVTPPGGFTVDPDFRI